jgi:hypothetical protein
MSTKRNLIAPTLVAVNLRRRPRSLSVLPVSLVLSAILLCMASAVHAGDSLEPLLSGKSFPLAVKLKDLNGEWRRFTLRGNGSITGNVSVNVTGNITGSASQNNLTGSLGGGRDYVTRGQTASAHGQTYLVAYHLPMAGLDLSALLQAVATKTPPTNAVLTPDSSLSLSLLDVRAISGFDDVRAFDAQREITESEQAFKALLTLLKGGDGEKKGGTNSPGGTQKK